jgi:hypothetical protein
MCAVHWTSRRVASYFIKRVGKDGATATPAMRFLSIQEALDFAAAALSQSPKDIWVEDERGCPVADMAKVTQHSKGAVAKKRPKSSASDGR